MTNADTTGLRPAIFMDRDNTLTVDAKGYTWRLSDFALIDGAAASLALFHKLGLPVFVVTNQGGIGKGLYSRDDMQHFHDRLAAEAIAAGGMITDFAFCLMAVLTQSIAVSPPPTTTIFLFSPFKVPLSKSLTSSPNPLRFDAVKKSIAGKIFFRFFPSISTSLAL